MSTKNFSPETVNEAVQKWQETDPEQNAAKTGDFPAEEFSAAKKAVNEAEAREHVEENFPFFPQISEQERAAQTCQEEIRKFADYINGKCERYVENRDLEMAMLSAGEDNAFRKIVVFGYRPGASNFELQAIVEGMLIDGLRYPDKKINDFCVDFLKREQEKTVSWTLWMNLWSRPFVPADAVRLMMFSEDGIDFSRNSQFNELTHVLAGKIHRHLENEYRRLEEAEKIAVPYIRIKEMSRKQRRIRLFKTLIQVYGL